MKYVLFSLCGYLSGSILYAYIIPQHVLKIDIREGSLDGNPGTANCFMNAGIKCGIVVLILELLKGALPIFLATHFLSTKHILFSLVLTAPVLGHVFPIFFHARGGKGIAVSFGVLLGLFPNIYAASMLALCYIFFSVIDVIKEHADRSIISYLCFCIICLLTIPVISIRFGCLLITAIVVLRHLFHTQQSIN